MALSKIKANSLGTTGTPTSNTYLSGTMAWTSLTADITGVTAGTGLNGGGSSGELTLQQSKHGNLFLYFIASFALMLYFF